MRIIPCKWNHKHSRYLSYPKKNREPSKKYGWLEGMNVDNKMIKVWTESPPIETWRPLEPCWKDASHQTAAVAPWSRRKVPCGRILPREDRAWQMVRWKGLLVEGHWVSWLLDLHHWRLKSGGRIRQPNYIDISVRVLTESAGTY